MNVFDQNTNPVLNSYLETLSGRIKEYDFIVKTFTGGGVFNTDEVHVNANANLFYISLYGLTFNNEGGNRQFNLLTDLGITVYLSGNIGTGTGGALGINQIFNKIYYGAAPGNIAVATTYLRLNLIRIVLI